MEQRFALIVGIDTYSDQEHFTAVPLARSDARALYDLLIDPEQRTNKRNEMF